MCAAYCKEYGLTFNAAVSKIVIFSKNNIDHVNLCPIILNDRIVEYTDTITYLGTTICNKKGFTFSSSNDLAKYYRATNAILRAVNRPSEEVLMTLLYSCCMPILSYACSVKEYPPRQMQECCTATNDALRFIFGYHRWESIRSLRESFGFKSLTDIFHITKRKFDASLPAHHNPIISHIARNMVIEQDLMFVFFSFFFPSHALFRILIAFYLKMKLAFLALMYTL